MLCATSPAACILDVAGKEMGSVVPYDPRREPSVPPKTSPEEEEESDHNRPISERELLARVDTRSMEMLQGLGRLTGEVAANTKRLEKVENRMRRRELRDAQFAADLKAIRDAMRREGRTVEEIKVELKDFVDDAEDSKRFVIEAKKRERERSKVVWAIIIGGATALGTMIAGAVWSYVTARAPTPHVEVHHEAFP